MSELFRRKIESSLGSEKINSFNFQIFKDSPNQLLKINTTKPTVIKNSELIEKSEPIKKSPAPTVIKKQETSVNLKNLTINEIGWKESTILSPPKVLIFGDVESESLEEEEIDLELPKWGLLHKICQAIKVPEISFARFIQSSKSNYQSCPNFKRLMNNSSPKYIFLLGASPLNFFEIKDRLSMIHGKVISKQFENETLRIIPLFHPEYLLINPNMKRKVWNDLQEIIKNLHQN